MTARTAMNTTNEVEEVLDTQDEQQVLQHIKQRSVTGALSYFFRTLVLNGIGLATAFILSAQLSPEDFGIFGYVTQFVGLFVFFSDIGLAAALVQKKTEPTDTDYKTAFTVQQILSWIIFFGFLAIARTGWVQQKTGDVGTGLLIALGMSFPLASLKTIPSIMLERRLDFNKLVLPQIFEQLVYNGVLIYYAMNHVGVQSYTYAIWARSVIGVIVMFMIQPWMPALMIDRLSLKNLMSFGAKFQLNDLLARIKDQFFYLYLGQILPVQQFGYVSWSKNWSMYPYNLTVQNIMAVTFPTFSRLQHHKEALAKAIEKSLFFITMVVVPLVVGMCLFITPLVTVVDRYHKWQPAVPSLIFFSLSIIMGAISSPLTNTLNAIGRINTTLKLMVMWTIGTWVLTLIAMRYFGYNGVAVGAFLLSFTSVIPFFIMKRIVKIDVWEQIWRQLFAAIAMTAVGYAGMKLWSQDIKWMLIGMVAASAAYGLSLLAVGYQKIHLELASLRKK